MRSSSPLLLLRPSPHRGSRVSWRSLQGERSWKGVALRVALLNSEYRRGKGGRGPSAQPVERKLCSGVASHCERVMFHSHFDWSEIVVGRIVFFFLFKFQSSMLVWILSRVMANLQGFATWALTVNVQHYVLRNSNPWVLHLTSFSSWIPQKQLFD